MTVHGAKGLEAPIVFLPDTCTTRSGGGPAACSSSRTRLMPANAAAVPVAGQGHERASRAVQQAKAASERAEAEERNRLLYVALTRARDRLYVAGFEGTQARRRRTAGTI